MNKPKVFLISVIFLAIVVAVIVAVPNPLGNAVMAEAKANGYLAYSPDEAVVLAKKICTQCHSDERIKLYCPRCGPPFIAVVPHMQVFIDNYKTTKPELNFHNITEHQAVAIVQVWNALVGNWEKDFREKDVLKLIGHYDKLAALLKTPVEKRSIEYALTQRDEIKIGHMSGIEDAQKNLGKPENNPQPGDAPASEKMDHSKMDHSKMNHDMGEMDHNKH